MARSPAHRMPRFTPTTPQEAFVSVLSRLAQVLCMSWYVIFAASAADRQRPDYGPDISVEKAKKIAAGGGVGA